MSSRRVTLGVDEAGRGSLVGDMFVAGVALADGLEEALLEAGVRDSKSLGRSRRRELLLDVIRLSDLIVVSRVVPEDIDRGNLNDLELRAVERILKHARSRRVALSRIVVDEIAGRKEALERFARKLFPDAEVVMKPKADREFVQVSAASIVAKCLRDEFARILSSWYGEFGSGYPSDPRTVRWLEATLSAGTLPGCVRRSWRTLRRARSRALDEFAKKK